MLPHFHGPACHLDLPDCCCDWWCLQLDLPVFSAPKPMDVPQFVHPPRNLPKLPLMEDLKLDRADLELTPVPRVELAWECGPEPEPVFSSVSTSLAASRAGSPPRSLAVSRSGSPARSMGNSRPASALPAAGSRPGSAAPPGSRPPSAQPSDPYRSPSPGMAMTPREGSRAQTPARMSNMGEYP